MRRLPGGQVIGPFVATMIVAALVAVTTDRFLDPGNLSNIILQVSIVSLVAIGSTTVILVGGIDLSPGSAIALMTMVFAVMVKFGAVPFALAIVLVRIIGCLLGAINGFLSAYLRIPSFIATLAALGAFRGAAFMFNNGSPVFSVSPMLDPLFYGRVLGIPLPLFYVVFFFGGAVILLRYTVLGRWIYAVGGNPEAARLAGINVKRVQFVAFVLAGFMAALGAILMAARLNSGSPNYGVGMELSAIAAAVIGGASLAGGRGSVINTMLGALTIVIVQNGLNLNAVPSSTQNVVVGAIIVSAVAIDVWRGTIAGYAQKIMPGIRNPGRRSS